MGDRAIDVNRDTEWADDDELLLEMWSHLPFEEVIRILDEKLGLP